MTSKQRLVIIENSSARKINDDEQSLVLATLVAMIDSTIRLNGLKKKKLMWKGLLDTYYSI